MKHLLILSLFLLSCGSSSELLDQMNKQDNQILSLTMNLNEKSQLADSLSLKLAINEARIQEYSKVNTRLKIIEDAFKDVHVILQTTAGDIELEFYPAIAPFHVLNFIRLAEAGFYNETLFHRTMPGFMIQGGDPNTRLNKNLKTHGSGGAIGNIPEEFSYIHHSRGILSMARSRNPNSASSQFFIMHKPSTHLDGKYTVFGKVVTGLDIVDKIATAPHIKKGEPHFNPGNPNYSSKPTKIISAKVFKAKPQINKKTKKTN